MKTAVSLVTASIVGGLLAGAAVSLADDRDDSSSTQRHQEKFPRQRLALEEFPWDDERLKPPGPPRPGVTTIYLHGSEGGYNVYTVAYRFDPNVQMPPHSHPDRRSCFVLGGVWYFGYGTTFDPAAMRELRAGAHYTEPSNAPHFAGSGPEGAVVECTAHGPSGTTFVNPGE